MHILLIMVLAQRTRSRGDDGFCSSCMPLIVGIIGQSSEQLECFQNYPLRNVTLGVELFSNCAGTIDVLSQVS
jgi:hypothetical protein